MNVTSIIQQGAEFLKGNEQQLKLSLSALIAGKHVLIEDGPGKGKTLLVKFIGKMFHLDFRRIQFTNDLMPADILGFNYFDKDRSQFIFKEGSIFADILLTDEINRGSSRTQSALLQAMEERQVSIDDKTYDLSTFFTVFATQNPREQVGTAPLPESQLDRFLFKFKMSEFREMYYLDLDSESLGQMKYFISKTGEPAYYMHPMIVTKITDHNGVDVNIHKGIAQRQNKRQKL
jgi:MoxR-like ATPase